MGELFQNLSIFIIANFYQTQPGKGLDGKNETGSRDKATPQIRPIAQITQRGRTREQEAGSSLRAS
jgi:hypothetical protein